MYVSSSSSSPSSPLTLGAFLRQARLRQGYSLAQLARQVRKADGRPISPQYLYALEHDQRRPSAIVLEALAHALCVSSPLLLARAQRAEALVRTYLEAHPAQEEAFIAFMRLAHLMRFRGWHQLRDWLLEDTPDTVPSARACLFPPDHDMDTVLQKTITVSTLSSLHES